MPVKNIIAFMNKNKKKSIFEDQASKAISPGPTSYKSNVHKPWTKEKADDGEFIRVKGSKITKSKRESITEEIMKLKKKVPGPHEY